MHKYQTNIECRSDTCMVYDRGVVCRVAENCARPPITQSFNGSTPYADLCAEGEGRILVIVTVTRVGMHLSAEYQFKKKGKETVPVSIANIFFKFRSLINFVTR